MTFYGVVLGREFQSRHLKAIFEHGGQFQELVVKGTVARFALEAANIVEPTLFLGISTKHKPIPTKSRCFNKEDLDFIAIESGKLQKDGIIEPNMSPWRAQVVELKNDPPQICMDFSQTINIYTELDAFTWPKNSDLVTNFASYKYFSSFDLKSVYHQIRLKQYDRKYTAFEAKGQLFEFKRLSFGVTNGVPAFQRAINEIVIEENLTDIFPYLDNVIIGGETEKQHDNNVENFMRVVKKRGLNRNDSKTIREVTTINT